jgi:large subunit ribosomal protein L1
MGKKKVSILGTENESALKEKKAVQRDQKKMRDGKVTDNKSQETVTVTEVKVKRTKAAKTRSKKYIEMKKLVPVEIGHSISEGISLIRKTSLAKFGGSVEMHITLADRNWSKDIELPHKLPGKAKRIVEVTDEVIAGIESGKFDFDILVATPAQMGKLVKYAKVLGPKGLMPNPKNGTVTENVDLAIKRLSSDTTMKLKTDKDGPAIHLVVGKMSMNDDQLSQNISAVMAILPAGRIKKVILKSTMSPAVKLNV